MPGRMRAVRRTDLRSSAPDRAAEMAIKGVLDAEAVAADMAIDGEEQLTAAWSERPSRLLGPRQGQMTYEEGIRLYISQGAAMQHAASAAASAPVAAAEGGGQAEGSCSGRPLRFAIAHGASAGGLPPGGRAAAQKLQAETCSKRLVTTEQCCSAVASMQHLPDVESHLEPEALALALALSNVPTSTAAVHVAALTDAAWRRVPSRVLGPRPSWLAACPEQSIRGWRYWELLQLSAAVGYERAKKALEQPCVELACLELQTIPEYSKYLENLRLEVDTAIENVERIAGVSLAKLLEGRSGLWGSGLEAAQATTTSCSEVALSSSCSPSAAEEGELLQLQLCIQEGTGESVVEITPPSQLPPPINISDYQTTASIKALLLLLRWAAVGRGRDMFVEGWGSFPISLELLEPPQEGSFLPTPAEVRARGYAAALFPQADECAASGIRRILAAPGSQYSPLARYIVRWSRRLNGPLAARIPELEAVQLGVLDEQEFDLPPETLLRRLEREQQAVCFERFDWLAAAGDSGDGPRILTTQTDSDGATLNVLLLTTSHQIATAGRALKNCISRSLVRSYIGRVRDGQEMLLVLCPGTDIQKAVAIASWTGDWSGMEEACNNPIRSEWEDMFLQAEAAVRGIWDAHQYRLYRLYYEQLMSWEHPTIDAAIAGSSVTKHTFATGLASVLAAIGAGNEVDGGVLAALLISRAGCSELFHPRQYCGFRSLKEFTQELPFPAFWNDDNGDGRVRFSKFWPSG